MHLFGTGAIDDSLSPGRLLLDGERVIIRGVISSQVHRAMKASKGSGVRKLRCRIANPFYGVSGKEIEKTLRRSKTYQQLKARFEKRPPLIPITASEVHKRHQIDLLNTNAYKVKFGVY